jgi:hypothetical protein
MNKVAFALGFLVVSGAMFGLCANAHIDFFPCEITERSRTALGEGPLVTTEGTCSFMDHLRDEQAGERERLTPAGWVMLVGFCDGIGLACGVALGMALRRR